MSEVSKMRVMVCGVRRECRDGVLCVCVVYG